MTNLLIRNTENETKPTTITCAKALVEKLTEELTVLKAKAEAQVDDKPGKNKIAEIEKKLSKAQTVYEEAQKKVDEQDRKKAEKQASKNKKKAKAE